MEYGAYALAFKALGDSTRLKILEMLSCGELCACDILESFDITQPTLSYHMKILMDSGLVSGHKEGTWMKYHNNQGFLQEVSGFWDSIMKGSEECICNQTKRMDQEGLLCEL